MLQRVSVLIAKSKAAGGRNRNQFFFVLHWDVWIIIISFLHHSDSPVCEEAFGAGMVVVPVEAELWRSFFNTLPTLP